MSTVDRRSAPKPPADWDLVLKRNPVERIKRDKAPLGIRDELPGADRRRLRGRRRGGHRAPPVVGPLPRQAEDRHVHAARQAPGRRSSAARAARDRRGLEPLRQGRRRALDAAERPAPLPRAREAARRLRAPRRRGHHDRRRLRRHRAQHHRLPRAGDRRRRALRLHADVDRRRPTSSTATPTSRTCRASTSTRSPPAPTATTRPRSTASRWSAPTTTAREGFGVLVGGGLSSVPRIARDLGVFVPKDEAVEVLAAITARLGGRPQLPRLAASRRASSS